MSDHPDAEDRAALGARTYAKVTGTLGQRLRDELALVAPDLVDQMIDYGFGDVYSRPGLTAAQRQLVIISILTAIGATERQVRVHVDASLNAGLTVTEITEAFMQAAVYCGFPRAINAVLAAREVFRERGVLPKREHD